MKSFDLSSQYTIACIPRDIPSIYSTRWPFPNPDRSAESRFSTGEPAKGVPVRICKTKQCSGGRKAFDFHPHVTFTGNEPFPAPIALKRSTRTSCTDEFFGVPVLRVQSAAVRRTSCRHRHNHINSVRSK